MRASLANFLEAAGYEVDSHASAEGFLGSGRLSSTDCLLLDVSMPGMGGLELQAHLDRIGVRIPSSS